MLNYDPLNIPTITQRVMAGIGITFILMVVYDCIAYAQGGNNATLSKAMQQIGFSWPIVIALWFGLGCHFFSPQYTEWQGWWKEVKPIIIGLLGWITFRVAWTQAYGGTG
jgi:hypothetical protein